MEYLSVCSGIEAATVAWHPLRWVPLAFAEIDKFPSAILSHWYGSNLPGECLALNGVPNLGNMENFNAWPKLKPGLLVGGTPCQSFSIAGLRKGMADPRGNLALVYLGIADRYRPEWIIWENVPGVLSSSQGRDFGSFLGALEKLGYHAAWRVLDAQFVRVDGFGRAVPQRRRRLFVVANSRSWRRAAAVLFERESLLGNSAPRREAEKDVAGSLAASLGGCDENDARDGRLVLAFGGNDTSGPINVATARNAHGGPMGRLDFESETFLADVYPIDMRQASRGEKFTNNRKIGSSGGAPGTGVGKAGDPAHAFGTSHVPAVAYDMRGRDGGSQFEGPHDTANIRAASGGSSRSYVQQGWAVRRLTPRECERLQGFEDDYTLIPIRGGLAADGPRYKSLGNSMAVNAMRWLGRRIEMVSAHA